MGNSILCRGCSPSSGEGNSWEVGDIRTSMKSSLGSGWALCNGSVVDTDTYPKMSQFVSSSSTTYYLTNSESTTYSFSGTYIDIENSNAVLYRTTDNKYYITYPDGTYSKVSGITVGSSTINESWEDGTEYEVDETYYGISYAIYSSKLGSFLFARYIERTSSEWDGMENNIEIFIVQNGDIIKSGICSGISSDIGSLYFTVDAVTGYFYVFDSCLYYTIKATNSDVSYYCFNRDSSGNRLRSVFAANDTIYFMGYSFSSSSTTSWLTAKSFDYDSMNYWYNNKRNLYSLTSSSSGKILYYYNNAVYIVSGTYLLSYASGKLTNLGANITAYNISTSGTIREYSADDNQYIWVAADGSGIRLVTFTTTVSCSFDKSISNYTLTPNDVELYSTTGGSVYLSCCSYSSNGVTRNYYKQTTALPTLTGDGIYYFVKVS